MYSMIYGFKASKYIEFGLYMHYDVISGIYFNSYVFSYNLE